MTLYPLWGYLPVTSQGAQVSRGASTVAAIVAPLGFQCRTPRTCRAAGAPADNPACRWGAFARTTTLTLSGRVRLASGPTVDPSVIAADHEYGNA